MQKSTIAEFGGWFMGRSELTAQSVNITSAQNSSIDFSSAMEKFLPGQSVTLAPGVVL